LLLRFVGGAFGGATGTLVGAGVGQVAGMFACSTGGGGNTEHGQQRANEASGGDSGRQVGDPNRVIREGKRYTDANTGNTVYVSGNRVVITNPQGQEVTQFVNSKANTAARVLRGDWIPQ